MLAYWRLGYEQYMQLSSGEGSDHERSGRDLPHVHHHQVYDDEEGLLR